MPKTRIVQSKIASWKPHRRDRNDETDYSEEQRGNYVAKAFSCPVGMPETQKVINYGPY